MHEEFTNSIIPINNTMQKFVEIQWINYVIVNFQKRKKSKKQKMQKIMKSIYFPITTSSKGK